MTDAPSRPPLRPAVDFLFSLERFGMKFGLANIEALCAALGHPELSFTSIHIAGTNGKGSVAAMVDATLRAAGHRAGRYTSPHLVRLEERFVIDGEEVSPAALDRSATRVQQATLDLIASGTIEALPTFFECTTAVAFDLFRDARVPAAVLETGLGGRLDSTNIVMPALTAIVSIDFDHQAQLGNTIASIAAEKAGIAKRGAPMVCGPVPAEAMDVIASVCAERGAPLILTEGDAALAARVDEIPLSLPGAHQKANAAVALRLLELLDGDPSLALPVDAAARRAGLSTAVWPGRLETIEHGGCRVLLDAAHNPAGARALADHLRANGPRGASLVFGAMKDKAVREMLAALAPIVRRIICTTAATPRAMPADELASYARGLGSDVQIVTDPFEAVEEGCRCDRQVVVAGSIFLIGPIRERLRRGILR
ncbi:MAG TPA: folylpolyglutamate synthase/dihydrofolate synthase family protein [Vicinamibacterales bacterium]